MMPVGSEELSRFEKCRVYRSKPAIEIRSMAMKDSRQRSAAPVRPAIFTAAFVAAQDPAVLAELLEHCYYDLVDAEDRRGRDVQEEQARTPPQIQICACGEFKLVGSARCRACQRKILLERQRGL
jgi:hypothetical protein